MKTTLTSLLILVLGAASAASAPVAMDECLHMVPQIRWVSPDVHKVTAHLKWTCDAKLVDTAHARLSVDGEPVGALTAFDPYVVTSISAYVYGKSLPMKVCVDLVGRSASSPDGVTARQCEVVDELLVEKVRAPRTETMRRPVP